MVYCNDTEVQANLYPNEQRAMSRALTMVHAPWPCSRHCHGLNPDPVARTVYTAWPSMRILHDISNYHSRGDIFATCCCTRHKPLPTTHSCTSCAVVDAVEAAMAAATPAAAPDAHSTGWRRVAALAAWVCAIVLPATKRFVNPSTVSARSGR